MGGCPWSFSPRTPAWGCTEQGNVPALVGLWQAVCSSAFSQPLPRNNPQHRMVPPHPNVHPVRTRPPVLLPMGPQ